MKPDQISRLFAATARSPAVSAMYWLPPLMLFTGARINELAQLRTDDLRPYNGRLHLSVLCLEDEGNENDDKGRKRKQDDGDRSVKSPAAKRLIPVHDELLRIGFAEFVTSRHARKRAHGQLFDDVRPNRFGHWSAAISKRINRQIRSLGITNEALSAYSLRHNFFDGCESNRIIETARMKFMGHQLPGMKGVYGNPHPLQHETDEIDRLIFPGVDMTPYEAKRR
jgi:integrase